MFFLHFSRLDRFTRIASLIKRDKNSYRINRQRFLRYARSVKRLNVKLNFSMRRFHDYSPEITRKGKENRKRETFLPVLSSIQDFNWGREKISKARFRRQISKWWIEERRKSFRTLAAHIPRYGTPPRIGFLGTFRECHEDG